MTGLAATVPSSPTGVRWERILLTTYLIYLAVCSIPPNTIAMVIAGYGATRFWLFNALRLAGAVAGATASRPR
jgi:hypothetical protein